ncbi:hypothetical protein [Nesterenkonia muleiensis]|uniref:hypothetical protein n=1 Tax=Nesterenkonia muleiensis TaxID=2282648 RepID=UPI000E73FB48|nr:hypothetical protein [Nesterenkonia muleiensis]
MSESPQAGEDTPQPLSRRARRAAAGNTGFRLNAIPFLIAGVLVVLVTAGLLWWFGLREEPEEAAEWTWVEEPADGVHARGVPPEDWETGWCLSGFTDEDSPADAVRCERNYDVQILLQREMDDNVTDGDYPGDDIVTSTAEQWCHEEVELSSAALEAAEAELQIELWHPTESTWNRQDDRLVSCFLSRADGGSLRGDFLATVDDDETSAEDSTVDLTEEGREPREEEDDDGGNQDTAENEDETDAEEGADSDEG